MSTPAGVVLLVPAGGRGTRFGSDTPKQFLPLAGMSVLAWSLKAFDGLVARAVVACDPAWGTSTREAARAVSFPVALVAGGETRLRSVAAALDGVQEPLALVHDAVRPLVDRACIEACIAALAEAEAAVVAVPCAPTVKRVRDDHVEATIERDALWLAQTPQGFRTAAGRVAYERALREGWSASDDAQLLERIGVRVRVVRGHAENFKITERADLAMAEAILSARLGAGSTFPPGR